MLNSILNAVAGVLHPQRRDAPTGPHRAEPGMQRFELIDPARQRPVPAAGHADARVSCWQRHADRVRALFAPPRRPVGDGAAAPPSVDLRGRRIELDHLWTSFEGAALDGTSLVLSDAALRGITAGADRTLPVALCMALQSLGTIDGRHADVRAGVLRQIVSALTAGNGGVAPEVSAVLRAYCDTTPWFAGVPEVEGLLGRGRA